MPNRDELQEIFERVERFLVQQRELYGDLLPDTGERPPETPSPTLGATPMKKAPTAREQENLFGQPNGAKKFRSSSLRKIKIAKTS